MTRSSLCATWVGALAAASAALLFQGGTARAQFSQCENDEDCGAGFVCNESSFESCSGDWTCDDEGNCVQEPGECQTYEQNYCSNATCGTNDDCPDYMLCQPQTSWTCEGGMAGTGAGGTAGVGGVGGAGGAGGFECGPEGCPEPVCYEVPAPSLCIARYQLPCAEASDCGGGFDCLESYYYECNGGSAGMPAGGFGGVGGAGGAAGTVATGGIGGGDEEPYECHQVPSGEHYCSLQNLPCESDAECPSGLECQESYEYGDCVFIPGEGGQGGTAGTFAGIGGAGGAAGTAGTGGVGGDADGGIDEPGTWECPPPVITHRCQPLSHSGGGMGGYGGGAAGMGGAGVGGTGGAGGAGGASGMGAEEPGSGNAGTSAAGAGGASEDDGDSDEHGHGHGHGRGRGLLKKLLRGCSAGGPVEGNAAMGWLMLGLATVVLRRRARRD